MQTVTDQNLLSDILNHLGPMVWSKDIKSGQISFLTDNFSSVFEISMDLIRLEPSVLKKSIHPEDIPFIDLFSKALLSNQFEELQYRIITPNQKVKWILERKQLVKNDLGEIIRLNAFLLEITDQKEEEIRLSDSEITFKSLFYKHPLPMWVYDTETLSFLAVNDAAVRFYGYTHDEFFRMTVRQIRPQEDGEELLSAIRSNNFEGYSEKKWRHFRKDGSQIYVRLNSNAIHFRGRKARVVLASDITQQIEAEAKTEKIYNYLERFQEAVSKNSLLALIDLKGDLQFINQNLVDKTEINSQHLIGKNWGNLLATAYNQEQKQEIWEWVNQGKIWKGQRKFLKHTGSHFWVSFSIIPIYPPGEEDSQFLLIADDISDLKEAEKRNKEYAIRIHNILEGITDAIFVLDKNWLLTNANLEAECLLDKKSQHLLGKNIWEIFPAEEGFKFYQFFRKAKKKRVTVEFEEFFAPKNRWYDISIYPSRDGLAVCFRDVSERRSKDEEMKRLMEQLFTQNRDLEEFTYITSHSLRAQIANVSMLCSAIDPQGMTPLNQEIFEKLFQSSANLDTVIADLNTILTVKNRKSILAEEFSIQNGFVNAVSRIPAEFSAFKKYISTDFGRNLNLYSVRNYIETILFQLITNSIRFRSVSRLPKIEVIAEKKGNQMLIRVVDNGRGFDMEKVGKQICQLYKTFCPGVAGKGLGLYLCKILVEELGGNLKIDSELEVGTTVSIYLPIRKSLHL